MKRKISLLVAASMTCSLVSGADAAVGPPPPAPSAATALHFSPPVTTRLENGLRVVVQEDHRAPFVSITLAYGVGTRDEPEEKPGLALITQRMMEDASVHLSPGKGTALLHDAGVSWTYATNLDTTSFSATAPVGALATVLWRWSEALAFFTPRIDKEMLDRASALSESERRTRVENAAYGEVGDLVATALYPTTHVYHRRRLDSPSAAITVADVRDFFDRHYAPDDAVLVLVGDVAPSAATELARTYFGDIPAAELPPRSRPPLPKGALARVAVGAQVQSDAAMIAWITPKLEEAEDADLAVLSNLLAGPNLSLLAWELIDRRKVATHVYAHQTSHALASEFRIWVDVADGHSPFEVVSWVQAILKASSRVITEEMVRTAIADTVIQRALAYDDPGRRAFAYARHALLEGDADGLAKDLQRYDHVSKATLAAAVERWLPPGHCAVGAVFRDANAPPGGVVRSAQIVPFREGMP